MRTGFRLLSISTAGLVVVVLGLILSRRPVLFTLTEPGEVTRPSVAVFNPLRNRAPEEFAEQILNELRRGDVTAAVSRIHAAANDDVAAKESQYRLRRWKLVNRVDGSAAITLFYRTDRGVSGQLDSEVVICVRRSEGMWVVAE